MTNGLFDEHLARWGLTPDGRPIATRAADLLPVRHRGGPAMLKVARAADERSGALVMVWWGGDGAARVLAREGDALLLERATGTASLAALARGGRDDETSRVLCTVASRLHAPRSRPPPPLLPLAEWFRELWPAASARGGLLHEAAEAARGLLAEPREVVVLHGDLHHDNVLDFGPGRGWLAIDPKRLVGERGFDFANILRNPDAATALAPGRLAWQAAVIAEAAALERRRLLRWTLALAGLSAAWILGDGEEPALDLAVAGLAAAELAKA